LQQFEQDPNEQLFKETKLRCALVLVASSCDELIQCLNVEFVEVSPAAYYIVYNGKNLSKPSVLDKINASLTKLTVPWKLKAPLDNRPLYYFVDEYVRVGTIKEHFILYQKSNKFIRPKCKVLSDLNTQINTDLKQVVVYEDHSYIFTSTYIASRFGLRQAKRALVDAGAIRT
jgi:hypothetical protein